MARAGCRCQGGLGSESDLVCIADGKLAAFAPYEVRKRFAREMQSRIHSGMYYTIFYKLRGASGYLGLYRLDITF